VLLIFVMIKIYSVRGKGKTLRKYANSVVSTAWKIHIITFWVMTPWYCLVNE
jgi:hypothetical protein